MRLFQASATVRAPPVAIAAGRLRRLAATVFINPNFGRLWWGQAISSVGDFAWDTALVLWIATYVAAGQSWAPLAVSGLILAAALPQIVVGPIAGVFVDRWDKRRTIMRMLALQTVIALALFIVAAGVPMPVIGRHPLPLLWELGVIYVDVALLTICAQFVLPAQLALVKDIVPQAKQDQALEASQAIQGLAIILGPPVAAALVFGLGIQWALLLNALSFIVALVVTRAIAAPASASSLAPGETGHFSREFLAGIGYVLGHGILRTILVAEVLAWLGFGSLQALGYFFITENLHAAAGDYGYLGSVFGVGAIVGAVGVTIFGQRLGLARLLWTGLITSGIFVIVLSHLTSLYPALGAAFCFGVTATAILVTAGPLALDATQREFVGRVTAVLNPVGRLAALISVILAGYLVSTVLRGFHATVFGITFGPVNAVFSGTGALAVLGGLYARFSLRGLIAKGEVGHA
jgi:MFS family permease